MFFSCLVLSAFLTSTIIRSYKSNLFYTWDSKVSQIYRREVDSLRRVKEKKWLIGIKLWLILINICKSPRSNTIKTILLIPLSGIHHANSKTYPSFKYLGCNSFTWKWKFLSLTYMWPRLVKGKKISKCFKAVKKTFPIWRDTIWIIWSDPTDTSNDYFIILHYQATPNYP